MTPTHPKTPPDAKSPAHQTIFPPAANHQACLTTRCSAAEHAASKAACAHTACHCEQADQEPERWDGMA